MKIKIIKKLIVLFTVIVIVVILTGCRLQVEDLLKAPAPTSDQLRILEEIKSEIGEDVVLRYPLTGSRRAPIQMIDLDGDGVLEAVAFYTVQSESPLTNISVLKKIEDDWILSDTIVGAGGNVNTVRLLEGGDKTGRPILVEWLSTDSQRVSIYSYVLGKLVVGFEENCFQIIMDDIDGDGLIEFCYITEAFGDESHKIKYVDGVESSFSIVGEMSLDSDVVSCINMISGKINDGKYVVYVDQYLEDNTNATAVYYIDSNGLNVFETEGYNLKFLTKRTHDKLLCGVSPSKKKILIPTDTPPREDILFPEIWKYWYDIYDGMPRYSLATFVNNEYNLNVGIPDSWLNRVAYYFDEEEKIFVFYSVETDEVYLEIKVLSVGEPPDEYIEKGFETVDTRSGTYRYYVRCEGCFPKSHLSNSISLR